MNVLYISDAQSVIKFYVIFHIFLCSVWHPENHAIYGLARIFACLASLCIIQRTLHEYVWYHKEKTIPPAMGPSSLYQMLPVHQRPVYQPPYYSIMVSCGNCWIHGSSKQLKCDKWWSSFNWLTAIVLEWRYVLEVQHPCTLEQRCILRVKKLTVIMHFFPHCVLDLRKKIRHKPIARENAVNV